ncbi:MAG TPA: response regulator [Kofleriaceae bacterium]|nr:response regulator [Kofleriaceae bacterium]
MSKNVASSEDLLSAVDAAKVLGVSADMVRVMAREGRLPAAAQTVRGVRLFRRSEVELLASERAGTAQSHHAVQFYDSTESLSGTVASFVAVALRARAPVVVIARASRHSAFCEHEEMSGVDVAAARDSGQLAFYDAGQTLATFMVGGMPEPGLFRDRIGEIIQRASAPRSRVRLRIYGEMVDILWREGHREAALKLEQMWNELARKHSFALLCAYDMTGFRRAEHEERFRAICAAHTHVGPAGTEQPSIESATRQREVALLQQRARALEGELELRKRKERALEIALAERDRAEKNLHAAYGLLAALGAELCDPAAAIRQDPGLGHRLVDFARLAGGEIAIDRQRLELAQVVGRAVELTAPLLGERGHPLDVRVPAGLALDVDADRMAQVVAAALTSAALGADAGAAIRLAARRDADSILLSVARGGAAIAADRGRGAADLAMARELVRLHGGSVADRAGELVIAIPAAGDLPAEDGAGESGAASASPDDRADENRAASADEGGDGGGAAAPAARSARPGPQGPSRRILVVDDNEDLASLISELLREHGHEVELALDAPSAIECAAAFAPDVALLDIGLPGMDGYALARELRQLRRELRLIAVTGYAQESDRRRSEEAGFSGHLVKPVNPDLLARIIRGA